MSDRERIDELLKSHAELRGAVMLAGKRLKALTRQRYGGAADHGEEPVLPILRRVLINARRVARGHSIT